MSALTGIRAGQGPFVANVCQRVWRLAVINVGGLVLMALGGGLLGFAPATVAMLAVSGDDAAGAGASSILKRMWHEWRTEFVRANAVLLPLLGALIVCLVGGRASSVPVLAFLLCGLALPIAILCCAALVAISRSAGTHADALANALLVLRAAPARVTVVTFGWPLAVLAALAFPPFGLWFALSAHAALALALLDPVLHTLEPGRTA